MPPRLGGDQTGADPCPVVVTQHRALHQITDAERRADLARIDIRAAKRNRRVPAQHVQPAVPAEQPDHVLGQPVGEIVRLLLGAGREEGQHGDRGLAAGIVRQRRRQRLGRADGDFILHVRNGLLQPRQWSRRRHQCGDERRCFLGNLRHLANEAEAAPMHCLDQFLLVAVVTDRAPRGVDNAGERGFRDDASVPHHVQKLVLAHHTRMIAHQMHQQVEHLRFQMHRRAFPAQFARGGIHLTRGEREFHGPRLNAGMHACYDRGHMTPHQRLNPQPRTITARTATPPAPAHNPPPRAPDSRNRDNAGASPPRRYDRLQPCRTRARALPRRRSGPCRTRW